MHKIEVEGFARSKPKFDGSALWMFDFQTDQDAILEIVVPPVQGCDIVKSIEPGTRLSLTGDEFGCSLIFSAGKVL